MRVWPDEADASVPPGCRAWPKKKPQKKVTVRERGLGSVIHCEVVQVVRRSAGCLCYSTTAVVGG